MTVGAAKCTCSVRLCWLGIASESLPASPESWLRRNPPLWDTHLLTLLKLLHSPGMAVTIWHYSSLIGIACLSNSISHLGSVHSYVRSREPWAMVPLCPSSRYSRNPLTGCHSMELLAEPIRIVSTAISTACSRAVVHLLPVSRIVFAPRAMPVLPLFRRLPLRIMERLWESRAWAGFSCGLPRLGWKTTLWRLILWARRVRWRFNDFAFFEIP